MGLPAIPWAELNIIQCPLYPRKRTSRSMSALCQTATLISLFDHLDRAREKTLRDFVSNILCRLQVDDEFKPQEICADGDRHVQRRRHERSARFLPEPARSDGGRADQSWRARLRHLFAAIE